MMLSLLSLSHATLFFFFFNTAATTEIYTLSLHDALPISSTRGCACRRVAHCHPPGSGPRAPGRSPARRRDRKSTRLNSSHLGISYAVFCLKKKKASHTATVLPRRTRYVAQVSTNAALITP